MVQVKAQVYIYSHPVTSINDIRVSLHDFCESKTQKTVLSGYEGKQYPGNCTG